MRRRRGGRPQLQLCSRRVAHRHCWRNCCAGGGWGWHACPRHCWGVQPRQLQLEGGRASPHLSPQAEKVAALVARVLLTANPWSSSSMPEAPPRPPPSNAFGTVQSSKGSGTALRWGPLAGSAGSGIGSDVNCVGEYCRSITCGWYMSISDTIDLTYLSIPLKNNCALALDP